MDIELLKLNAKLLHSDLVILWLEIKNAFKNYRIRRLELKLKLMRIADK